MKPFQYAVSLMSVALAGISATPVHARNYDHHPVPRIDMVRSGAVVKAGCLPQASGKVRIKSIGPVEIMDVKVEGLSQETHSK